MALALSIPNISAARGSEQFSLCVDRRGPPASDRQWAIKASLSGATEVLKALEQALQSTPAIQDPTEKTCALVAIAVAQARAGGDVAAARSLREGAQIIFPVQNGIAEGTLNRLEEQQGQELGIKSRRRSLDW